MATVYRIRDWDKHFEVSQSKKVKGNLPWIAVPTKHDGKSYRRLMRMEDGPSLYAAWLLIAQVAAKCPTRGVLFDDGNPLTPEDLELKTDCPADVFKKALKALCDEKIGWLESIENYCDPTTVERDPTTVERDPIALPTRTDGRTDGQDGRTDERPTGVRPTGLLAKVSEETLSDSSRLAKWHSKAAAAGIAPAGESGFIQAQALAAKCLAKGDDPVRMFVAIVRDGMWDRVTLKDEDAAKKKSRARDGPASEVAASLSLKSPNIPPRDEY